MPKLACCFPSCGGNTCELQPIVRAGVLATPIGTYTANITGTGMPETISEPFEDVTFVCSGLGAVCPQQTCCRACHPLAVCDFIDCNMNEKEVLRYCNNIDGVSLREFSLGAENLDCQCLGGNPNPCPICTGVVAPIPFVNNNLVAYAPATFFWSAPVCPAGQNPCAATFNVYNLGSQETGAGGNTQTYKELRLHEWQTGIGTPAHVCHLSLELRFAVRHNQPFVGSASCTGTDGFTTSLRYRRVWNGVDNAAAFLAKPLYLTGVRWAYSLCPFNNAPVAGGLTDWNCVTLDTYTPTDCGIGDCPPCTPRNPVFKITNYNIGRVFTTCHTDCASAMNPIIDAFQPWTSIPTTIALT